MSELTNLFKLILSLPMEQLALLIVGFSLVVVYRTSTILTGLASINLTGCR